MMSGKHGLVTIKSETGWEQSLQNENWVAPQVDIYETDDDYIVSAALPGVPKEQVRVKIEQDALVIMGRINYEQETKRRYIMRESGLGNYYRELRLSESVDRNRIDAEYKDGLLTLTLGKHERMKPRNIEIE